MPKFDLTRTHELADLLFVEREQRDSDWVRRFYQSVGDAGMVTTQSRSLRGPTASLTLFSTCHLQNERSSCYRRRKCSIFAWKIRLVLGVEPYPEPPERVIPFGQLWSKKQFQRFDVILEPVPDDETVSPIIAPEVPGHLARKQAVLAGQPSESYFPAFARNAVRKFLVEQGIQSPRTLLLRAEEKADRDNCFLTICRGLR